MKEFVFLLGAKCYNSQDKGWLLLLAPALGVEVLLDP